MPEAVAGAFLGAAWMAALWLVTEGVHRAGTPYPPVREYSVPKNPGSFGTGQLSTPHWHLNRATEDDGDVFGANGL